MTIKIGNKIIGEGRPVLIVVDIGVNYFFEGEDKSNWMRRVRELIDAAAAGGADCVKGQIFSADEHVSPKEDLAMWQVIKDLEMPLSRWAEIKKYTESKGMAFFATPFDLKSVDILEQIDVQAYKVPSAEITNPILLERIASTKKPVIISTGGATMPEIQDAVNIIKKYHEKIILLQCCAQYPSRTADANLRVIRTLEQICPIVGYSCHVVNTQLPGRAVCAGAKLVEVHLCISRTQNKHDAPASFTPEEFKTMCGDIRWAEKSLGDGIKKREHSEEKYISVARKSLYAARDIKAGEPITADMMKILRPPKGMEPKYFNSVIGRKAKKDIPALSPLYDNDLERQGDIKVGSKLLTPSDTKPTSAPPQKTVKE